MTSALDLNKLASAAVDTLTGSSNTAATTESGEAFEAFLSSAMDLVNETNTLQNNAELEKINFALGNSDNTHDLSIAMQKASLSLQYTVAVKNTVLSAYKEIMNIQI